MAYLYYRTLTINHAQCGASNSSNFPVLFSSPLGTVTTLGTAVTWASGDKFPNWFAGNTIRINGVVYTVASVTSTVLLVLTTSAGTQASAVAYNGTPWLATVANGGRIQNTHTQSGGGDITTAFPADLVFSPNTDGSAPYAFEYDAYNPITGDLNAWITIPTVSSSVDTVFYAVMDDTTVTTFQGNVTGTWDSNYKGVYHLADGTTLSAKNSTAAGVNDGTIHGSTSAVAGQIDGAASFTAFIGENISFGTAFIPAGPPPAFTFSGWANSPSTAHYGYIFDNRANTVGSAARGAVLYIDITTGKATFYINNATQLSSASSISDGTWHFLVGSYDLTNLTLYVDGASVASAAGTSGTGIANFADGTSVLAAAWDISVDATGLADEVRVSSGVARSADWILTEFHNQAAALAPDVLLATAFMSVGIETAVSGDTGEWRGCYPHAQGHAVRMAGTQSVSFTSGHMENDTEEWRGCYPPAQDLYSGNITY